MRFLTLAFALICGMMLLQACVVHFVQGRTPDEWKSRVIYQLLTDRFSTSNNDSSSSCSDLTDYCGGTFEGVVEKLDYIQGLGASAIWISPIPDQTDKGYHGYWQKDITKINPHFGSEEALKELVKECHKRDIWVMLDVVGNHVGNQKFGDWDNFSSYFPFNHREHYHSYCLITDYTNQSQVEICRLAYLPDLDQSNSYVRSTLKQWVQNVVKEYDMDGIRIDTIPEVLADFWVEYTQAAGVYSVGEVFNGDPRYVSSYQGCVDGTLNYPMYYALFNVFQKGRSMRLIHDGINANSVFKDVSILGNFLDNHDNDRFLHNQQDWQVLKNGLAYVIYAEGIPIIYYGTEQAFSGQGDLQRNRESLWPHYDTNSDLYKFISVLTNFRNKLGTAMYESPQVERYVDDEFFAFTRDKLFVATSNIGSDRSLTRTITYHPYSDGTELMNVLDQSKVVVSGGKFDVNIQNGLPLIYYPASSL